jgi:hypothetical protein
MNELSYTRILLLEIRDRITDHVVINDLIVKSLHLHLQTKRYDTIEMVYGKEFMDALIKIHEEYELYEECAEMVKQINNIPNI